MASSCSSSSSSLLQQRREALRKRYAAVGQDHVLEHCDTLGESELKSLLDQLDGIQVEKLSTFLKAAQVKEEETEIGPFAGSVVTSRDEGSDKWTNVGLEAIGAGKVAALVLAGGQGTRLGYDGPKGCYNISLPSGKTLFELICDRITKLKQLSSNPSAKLPFYIMTSPLNHEVTKKFFADNDNFGVDVHFFEQGMLPCLTKEGKIILQTAHKVAMAPDGNGGIYPSLQASGTLKHMQDTGIEYLHVFSIDNALCRPADPAFVGYCISQKADCGNKVLWKASAHEKVGVMAAKGGKPCIVEYSDISTEMAERVDDNGKLVFGAGNICNHFYTVDFIVNTVLANLENMYHVAVKKIPYYDGSQTVTPDTSNGIKLETFIFDVFPLSKSMAVMDVLREEEFAPVKNAPGSSSDSPDTARTMISNLAQKWLEAAGAVVHQGDEVAEVLPLTSYAGEGLESFKGKKLDCPFSV